MSLAYYSEIARSGQRARFRMVRGGVNINGDKIWTDAEIQVLRQTPSNVRAHQQLPHRSLGAIENKRSKLGLSRHIHMWTAAEISKLRRMYPRSSKEELCAAFPDATWVGISHAASRRGFRREKPLYKHTGHQAIDQIREKCYAIGWTLADLDREAKTKGYFAYHSKTGRPNYKAIGRALKVLQGRILIEWEETD